jgi:glycosyltransferase involved in cell wall biosynthesis
MAEPLYVEVSSILAREFTGIGRFIARTINYLARRIPLRLVASYSFRSSFYFYRHRQHEAPQEIAVDASNLPDSRGLDIAQWRTELLRLPRSPFNADVAARSAILHTFLRSEVGSFRRELGILYDFAPTLLPYAHEQGMKERFDRFCTKEITRFHKVIADSCATKTDAEWLCAYPGSDIVVALPGPSQCVDGHLAHGPSRRRRELFLAVSIVHPRKNAPFLLDWFLTSPVVREGSELWWVGPVDHQMRHWSRLRRREHGRTVKFLGMVSDARLCRLYQEVGCTVYPSLYEGFGFPVLDSLFHGTPVLCSFNSSLREFAGPGVFYFDACYKPSLDDAYGELCAASPDRIERPDLRERCTWEGLADAIAELAA